MDDHDLLMELKADICWIKKMCSNHLKHHWLLEAGIVLALLGAIASKLWG